LKKQTVSFELIKEEKGDSFPVALVGNECDLEKDRAVTFEEGKKKAEKYQVQFFEASARSRNNVDETFMKLADYPKENPKEKTKGCFIM
jgi:GTPase SAR1 family protein